MIMARNVLLVGNSSPLKSFDLNPFGSERGWLRGIVTVR